MSEPLVVAVTYDPAVGYRTTGGPELPVVRALSLGGIRRRVEALMLPDDVHIVLHLDRAARRERVTFLERSQQPLRFLLRQPASNHRLRYLLGGLAIKLMAFGESAFVQFGKRSTHTSLNGRSPRLIS
jgi:hypothetical protein